MSADGEEVANKVTIVAVRRIPRVGLFGFRTSAPLKIDSFAVILFQVRSPHSCKFNNNRSIESWGHLPGLDSLEGD